MFVLACAPVVHQPCTSNFARKPQGLENTPLTVAYPHEIGKALCDNRPCSSASALPVLSRFSGWARTGWVSKLTRTSQCPSGFLPIRQPSVLPIGLPVCYRSTTELITVQASRHCFLLKHNRALSDFKPPVSRPRPPAFCPPAVGGSANS